MFFSKKPPRLDEELSLVQHQGIFRKRLTLFQGVALIVSATIGAGVLSLPYAIAQVGLGLGMVYIVCLGLMMIGFNLLLGEIACRTRGDLQLPGLARKYLGKIGAIIMTAFVYLTNFGILVVYIIGTGQSLQSILGGTAFRWSLIFFIIASFFIFYGVRTIKVVDFWLSIAILLIIILIAGLATPHINYANWMYSDFAHLLFPYGVILFAYNGSVAVLEAHSILADHQRSFRLAIIISGFITMVAYTLFSLAVIGVTGAQTSEIATIGLGNIMGNVMLLFGSIFAFLAMGTSFLTIALSIRDSLTWDYKIKSKLSTIIVLFFPLVIFLAGLQHFIAVIDIVGGVFISTILLMVIVIYWRAKSKGDLDPSRFGLHHTMLLAVAIILALTLGSIYSVFKLF